MSQTVLSTTDSIGLSKPAKAARIYPCSRCPKTFKRSEHCSRHERGHTQEKPFHCKYCGRRYARKDLVNRHERSFHPLADKINPDSTENEVVVVDCPRSPPTPDLAVRGSSPSHTLATILGTPLDSEAESMVQNTIHVNPAGVQSTFNGVPSPSPSVVTFLEPGTTTGIDESQTANVSAFAGEKSSVGTSSTINLQRSISDLHAWNASDMMWQNADQFANSDNVSQSNVGHTTHPPQDSDHESYFNNFDILSMMPKNGVDFEGDFSTYLIHSGYSPAENLDLPRQASGNSPLLRSSLPETNNSHPISIGAKAVPFNTERELGSGTFSRMPNVMKETPRKLPVPVVDSEAYESIVADAKKRLSPDQLEEIEMLSSQDMQQFLTSYFTCFHRHCPILHPTSMDLKSVPSYLVFAICALGALYRLRRKTAKDLWYWANLMVEKELPVPSSELFSPTATAAVQCRMLLGMFAIFSGGDMTERAISGAGYWSTEYRNRRSALALMPYNPSTTEWEQWISREASKRLLYGIFIMSSMTSVTYDLCPAFSVTQDLEIEILDEECLWEASTLEQWQALRKSQTPRSSITVRDAMNHLIFGKEDSDANPTRWTAFATTMIFHAVNVHMWHIMQCTQSFTAFAVDEQNNRVLKAALILQVETALARCYALLTADRSERDHTSDDPEGPLIFNCLALLRSAYVRVFTGAGNFDRMMLLSQEPLQVANSVNEYVTGPQERTAFLTRAVDKAYGGLLTPIKAGYLLVQKTAALSWSVEHAVAAWDCALFVTKWIHAMEMQQQELPPNQEEMRNLVNFRELLEEVDSDYKGFGSLAGEVTRIWAGFLDDTWVFGITPRMGKVLRQLSNAFAQDWKAKFPQGNPAGPISR